MNGMIDYVIDHMYQVDSIYKVPRIYLRITISNSLYGSVHPGFAFFSSTQKVSKIYLAMTIYHPSDNIVKFYESLCCILVILKTMCQIGLFIDLYDIHGCISIMLFNLVKVSLAESKQIFV